MRVVLRVLVVAAAFAATLVTPAIAQPEPGAAPEIKVLNEGRTPREALRLAVPVGTTQSVSTTMRQSIEQSGASSGSVDGPPVRSTVSATVQDITPDGDIRVALTYPSFDVLKGNGSSAKLRLQVERALEGLNGLSSEVTLSPQGFVTDANFTIPSGVNPTLAQFLDQLGSQLRAAWVPFPASPVGTGARWRASSILTVSGIQLRQEVEYTLRRRTGTTLELDFRGTQTANDQALDLPNAPAGAKVRLTKMRTRLRGSETIDLAKVLSARSRSRGTIDQSVRIDVGSESGTLRQHVDLRSEMKPA